MVPLHFAASLAQVRHSFLLGLHFRAVLAVYLLCEVVPFLYLA